MATYHIFFCPRFADSAKYNDHTVIGTGQISAGRSYFQCDNNNFEFTYKIEF